MRLQIGGVVLGDDVVQFDGTPNGDPERQATIAVDRSALAAGFDLAATVQVLRDDGTVEFTGVLVSATLDEISDTVVMTLRTGAQRLKEQRMGGLILAPGMHPAEAGYSVLRLGGVKPDGMRLQGLTRPVARFEVVTQIDARIQDAPPASPLYVAAMELLDHFQAISGVKGAIATKLLATKRPALYPVIDDRVREVYAAAPAQFPAATHPFFAAVRRDVLGDGAAPLNGLRAALLADGQPHALRLAQVPGIRLRDIVLWQRYQTVGAPSAGGGAW